ncbi:hypothetical protein IFR04_010131 [Cadophora malorum]|uniref:Protein kinase domain-containing protein n=1 Tax=Cadophora malorum TaxID=108018 RepID=A0A8H7W9U2_9HELO|nr:hypothetical protein IFR04_010131 [Cadophora malorum]
MPPMTRAMKRTSKLHSLEDIFELMESFTDEGGRIAFSYTSFSFIDIDFNCYVGRISERKRNLTLHDANDHLQHIPDEYVYPSLPPHFTPAPGCIDGCWIKRPSLLCCEDVKAFGQIPKLLQTEIAAMEILSANPHPNIAKYHGCIVKCGRVVGIVLDKYATTLEDRVLESSRPFDKILCLDQVKSAIDHIHSLGLAHNDINPNNIMLDDTDTAFLIDIGCCCPVGEIFLGFGTPGWMEERSDYNSSKQSHDLSAFSKLQEWIENPTKDPYPEEVV